MAAKKKTAPSALPAAPAFKKDEYEEGVFAALRLLGAYVDEKCDALREVDAGIATGLLGPVVNILGGLRSEMGSRAVDHLNDRRERAEAQAKVMP